MSTEKAAEGVLSRYSDAEISREIYWRMQRKAGDPRIGVTSSPTPPQTGEEWKPIKTAPYGQLLCWVPFPSGDGAFNLLCKDEDGNWINDDGRDIAPYAPTHWRHLPTPPQTGEG